MYPNRFDSWALRVFFERALFGDAGGDSLAKAYGPKMESLIAVAKARPTLSDAEIGTIFFARRSRAYGQSATAADTAEMKYWLNRMLLEHPRHMQLAQYYAFGFTPEQWKHPSREVLDSLERLYQRFAPLTGPGRNLILSGERMAESAKDDSAYRRWSERSVGAKAGEDSYRSRASEETAVQARRPSDTAPCSGVVAAGARAHASAAGGSQDISASSG
jgi:hypothetical protein